jgi:hypothetical protein
MAHFIPIYLQTLMSALEPNDCNGICHNTLGGYYCTHCPHGKVFEPAKRKCVTSAKLHIILLGESSAFQLSKCRMIHM